MTYVLVAEPACIYALLIIFECGLMIIGANGNHR